MSILADRLVSYDHQDEINMIGSITLDSAYSTYIAVLNCRTWHLSNKIFLAQIETNISESHVIFNLFGDTHLRWYAFERVWRDGYVFGNETR